MKPAADHSWGPEDVRDTLAHLQCSTPHSKKHIAYIHITKKLMVPEAPRNRRFLDPFGLLAPRT